MMNRYHIRNAQHMVEFPATPSGRMQAVAFRRSHAEFKRKHIREVLQLMPTQVQCGVIVEWHWAS